jgi:hypothetical protein
MATNKDIIEKLETAARRYESVADSGDQVLTSEGEKDIDLPDGRKTPNLNKRLASMVKAVNSVNGKTGDVVITREDLNFPTDEQLARQEKEDRFIKTWSGRTQRQKNLDFVSIKDYGGSGSNLRLSQIYPSLLMAQVEFPNAKDLNDTLDILATEKSLINFGYAYLPKGDYWFNRELKLDDNQKIFGDGRGLTIINQTDDCQRDQCCITNIQNTRTQDNTYNHSISIYDLTINGRNDARFPTTIGGGIASSGGCGISLVSVNNGFIRNVHVINPVKHAIDIAASVYIRDGATVYPKNPSKNIRLEWCEVEEFGDDGITTHFSGNIEMYGIYAHNSSDHYTVGNSNGIEIDDGSYDVKVYGGYVFDCTKGVQVKAHADVPSATRVFISGVTAEDCNRAFECRHEGFETTSEQFSPTAFDVVFDGCTAINPKGRQGTTLIPRAMRLSAYAGVSVRDFSVIGYTPSLENVDPNESETEGDDILTNYLVVAQNKARNIEFSNIRFYNIGSSSALMYLGSGVTDVDIDGIFVNECEGSILYVAPTASVNLKRVRAKNTKPTKANNAIYFQGAINRQLYSFEDIQVQGDYVNIVQTGTTTPRYYGNGADLKQSNTTLYSRDVSPLILRRDGGGDLLTLMRDAEDVRGFINATAVVTALSATNGNILSLETVSADGLTVTRWRINPATGSWYPAETGVNDLGQATRMIKNTYTKRVYFNATVFDTAETGSPEGVATGGIGSTWRDTFSGDLYSKKTGTGNTGWVKIG